MSHNSAPCLLKIKNFGQIREADIKLRDLTVFVGPQASGKSIALQLFKLALDHSFIWREMSDRGLDWDHSVQEFLDAYMGEGMSGLWTKQSRIEFDGMVFDLRKAAKAPPPGPERSERVFYVPAQRVLTMRDGWPRTFMDYSSGDPYVVRDFSELLRREVDLRRVNQIFPVQNRLRTEYRDLIAQHILSGFHLAVDKLRSQKRLVLKSGASADGLPFMVWSAGQREFVPLLLGLEYLLPAGYASRRDRLKWVVLEEIEMGLHPRAISVVLTLVFELLHRGYRVCLSTHSPQVLEAVWAMRRLQENQASAADLLALLEAPAQLKYAAESALKKASAVYYFGDGETHEISSLDPDASDADQRGWGGLAEFSGRANEIVAGSISAARRRSAG